MHLHAVGQKVCDVKFYSIIARILLRDRPESSTLSGAYTEYTVFVTLSLPTKGILLKMLTLMLLLKIAMHHERHFQKANDSPLHHPTQRTVCTLMKMMTCVTQEPHKHD